MQWQHLAAGRAAAEAGGDGLRRRAPDRGGGATAFLERGYLRNLLDLSTDAWRRLVDQVDGSARLWTAEIWCRQFLDGQGTASVERDLWVPERM
jgi:hypothetical protein